METLEKLFGSAAKVKLMRLFLFNGDSAHSLEDVSLRAKVSLADAKKEMATLEKMGLVKGKDFTREVSLKRRGKQVLEKKKFSGWELNRKFEYLLPLQNLLTNISPLKHDEIIRKVSGVGKIKLIIIAGVFIQNWESRVDILVVGDKIDLKRLETVIAHFEAEVGKELRYSAFETDDFTYRLGVCDKLVRDILDFPHEKVLDKMGLTY
jgi:hypothetical protein